MGINVSIQIFLVQILSKGSMEYAISQPKSKNIS